MNSWPSPWVATTTSPSLRPVSKHPCNPVFRLEVNQRYRVDFKLQVGAVVQTVA